MTREIIKSNLEEKTSINAQLKVFNREMLGIPPDAQSIAPLNYVIKLDNHVIAGINAGVYFLKSILHIETLFVDEAHRGQRIGSQLMHTVENEAKILGAGLSHVDAFDWQGKDFYLKRGYEIFGALEDCPTGHTRYYLKKKL